MTKAERKDLKIEFNEKNLLLVLCRRICTALIVLTIVCVVCAVIANSYDDKVFSPEFQQTGGYVFVDYFFSKLLYGIFGNWSSKFYVITFLLMFVLIVLKIVLNTLFNIKWKNFINEKNNPTPKMQAAAIAPVNVQKPVQNAYTAPSTPTPVVKPAPVQHIPVQPAAPIAGTQAAPAIEENSASSESEEIQ